MTPVDPTPPPNTPPPHDPGAGAHAPFPPDPAAPATADAPAPAGPAPAVELKGLEVRAGRQVLLGPTDLVVDEGEHLLLVGPSGCGKTTLLRALAGFGDVRAGGLSLFGRVADEGRRRVLRPEERQVGMLFQGGALWPHMSVRATLRFVLKHAGVPLGQRKARVAELLEWVELTGFEKRKAGTLSGGEAQRLALARALASSPRLLLLDEPLGPLDADLRQGLLARLGVLQRELGLTVVHVTHDPHEAEALASRTARMSAGKVVDPGLRRRTAPLTPRFAAPAAGGAELARPTAQPPVPPPPGSPAATDPPSDPNTPDA